MVACAPCTQLPWAGAAGSAHLGLVCTIGLMSPWRGPVIQLASAPGGGQAGVDLQRGWRGWRGGGCQSDV